MIKPDARLSIRCLSLSEIIVTEYQQRYPNRVLLYVQKLLDHPGEYAGLLSVTPSDTHQGLYVLLDGYHRYCASILAGRPDALCVIIEEEKGNAAHV